MACFHTSCQGFQKEKSYRIHQTVIQITFLKLTILLS